MAGSRPNDPRRHASQGLRQFDPYAAVDGGGGRRRRHRWKDEPSGRDLATSGLLDLAAIVAELDEHAVAVMVRRCDVGVEEAAVAATHPVHGSRRIVEIGTLDPDVTPAARPLELDCSVVLDGSELVDVGRVDDRAG